MTRRASDRQRFAFVVAGAVVLVGTGLLVVWNATEPQERVVVVADSPTLVAPRVPASSSTTAPALQLSQPSGPIAPPADEYAPEPVLRIGSIEIPKIGLVHETFHGITMHNIDKGPSHWPGSALPGEIGNAVYMGHRVTKTRPFRNIHLLVPGDEVFITVDPAAFGATGSPVRTRYVVTGSEVVSPDAIHIVTPTPTATATLFACHPPGSARQRYVVHLALATA
ncbi:MAG TPA: class E sortase [Acidimicrobiales bacterium]